MAEVQRHMTSLDAEVQDARNATEEMQQVQPTKTNLVWAGGPNVTLQKGRNDANRDLKNWGIKLGHFESPG